MVDDFSGSVSLTGDGSADDKVDVENAEVVGDTRDDATTFSASSAVREVAPLLRLQDAKAARCSGKQPCRDSLSRQASGYISIRKRMN
jgi:hypothetical protein